MSIIVDARETARKTASRTRLRQLIRRLRRRLDGVELIGWPALAESLRAELADVEAIARERGVVR